MTGPIGDERRMGERALRLAVVTLPHLAGLARKVRLCPDRRQRTAGVFASGRLVYNPDFLSGMEPSDAAFVMAHELMHLALHTHRRGQGADGEAVNIAHDYIINDMLVQAFGRPVPGRGLELPGASLLSLERLLGMLGSGQLRGPGVAGGGPARAVTGRRLHGGLHRDELLPPPPGMTADSSLSGDALSDEVEREWFPEMDPAEQVRRREELEKEGVKAVSLGTLREALDRPSAPGGPEGAPEGMLTNVLRGYYRTPWEAALQKWMEFVAPGDRTFARPSRRGADRSDVVLPGRARVGWTLNIILDTSGSMTSDLPRALGAIASFCESARVWQVRLLQCDTDVTVDEFVEPEQMAEYSIRGLGGSDMSPALLQLARDPEVEAAIVLTDGYIDFPAEPMPYEVLWGILTDSDDTSFSPPYGRVIAVAVNTL